MKKEDVELQARARRSWEAGVTPGAPAGERAFQPAAFGAGKRSELSLFLVWGTAVRIRASCCRILLIANLGDYPLYGG